MFISQTGILCLLGLFFVVDMTHSSSSVNLIPAAEDEAGLSVIHPEGRQTDEHKKTDMQVHRSMIVKRPKFWRSWTGISAKDPEH